MSKNDQRSVVQVQDLTSPLQINEALRILNVAVTKLEGRQGQILLKDGFHSTSSNQVAAQWDAEKLKGANFGVYFAGIDGADTWLANGATLSPSAEWVATKTRAQLIKFDNITGIQLYLNTGLTVGASFIPTLQSGTTLTPVWGEWGRAGDQAGNGAYVWNVEIQGNASYFNRVAGNTQIQILKEGYYHIYGAAAGTSFGGGGSQQVQIFLNLNGVTIAGGFNEFPLAVGTFTGHQTFQSMRFLHVGDLVEIDLAVGTDRIGSGQYDTLLTIQLIQS